MLWLSIAFAQTPNLRELELRVAEVEVRHLEVANTMERSGSLADSLRVRGIYEDSVFYYITGDIPRAAMGFYVLLNMGTDQVELLRDSEWYLANAYIKLGLIDLAAQELRGIADDPSHGFRDDALEQLILLYAEHGPVDAFQQLYNEAVGLGRVTPTSAMTYSLGRVLYLRGDTSEARRVLKLLVPSEDRYNHAQYILGVMALRAGDLAEARRIFEVIADRDVEEEGLVVRDLARLAVARIHYDAGHPSQASLEYEKISADSSVYAQAQKERVWTRIAVENWPGALDVLDDLEENLVETSDAADYNLLRGHLYYKLGDYLQADTTYTDTSEAIQEWVAHVQKVDLSTLEEAPTEGVARGWLDVGLAEQSGLKEARAIITELHRQEQELVEIDELLAEVALTLSTESVLGRYQSYRDELDNELDTLIRIELEALRRLHGSTSTAWTSVHDQAQALSMARDLRFARVSDARAEVRRIKDQLEEGADEARLEELRSEIHRLDTERRAAPLPPGFLQSLHQLGEESLEATTGGVRRRAQALLLSADQILERILLLREDAGKQEDAARIPIEAVFQTEIRRYATLQQDHRRILEQGERLWEVEGERGRAAFIAGLERTQIQADAGRVDAHWNLLMLTKAQLEELQDQLAAEQQKIEQRVQALRSRLR